MILGPRTISVAIRTRTPRIDMFHLPDLQEFWETRKRLGIHQKRLARDLNVSQSMLHQAERKKRTPSYRVAKKIADYLDREIALRLKNNGKTVIGDICCWNLVRVELKDSVDTAVELLLKGDHGDSFSQLPVF